jgi:hypothetical protein
VRVVILWRFIPLSAASKQAKPAASNQPKPPHHTTPHHSRTRAQRQSRHDTHAHTEQHNACHDHAMSCHVMPSFRLSTMSGCLSGCLVLSVVAAVFVCSQSYRRRSPSPSVQPFHQSSMPSPATPPSRASHPSNSESTELYADHPSIAAAA